MKREIGSEWDFTHTRICDTNKIKFLRSCRDCLYSILSVEKINSILLPAYSCDSMILPYQEKKISYYSIDKNFKLGNFPFTIVKEVDAILIINYFGLTIFNDEIISKIKLINPNIIIIEDITQNLFDGVSTNKNIDYFVCSLRKWFSIPDGGCVISNANDLKFNIKEDESFSDLKYWAGIEKYNYLHNFKFDSNFKNRFKEANSYLDQNIDIIGISKYSRNILSNLDYYSIKKVRNQNFDYLKSHLLMKIQQITSNPNSLYFAIYLSNRDVIQKKLSQFNIFCPVIWDINEKICNQFPDINYISHHILAIPIDQRYNIEDMEYICSTINSLEELI